MTNAERRQAAFQRPKRWFSKDDWKKVKKQKVFGFTTSNGKSLAFLCAKPWNKEQWARDVVDKLHPFLKSAFPGRTSFHILMDGEKLLNAPVAKAALKRCRITLEPWPKYSPDMNPQENVWKWAEDNLRKRETGRETFEKWAPKVLKAVTAYPYETADLIATMVGRIEQVYAREGGMTDY